MKTKLLFSSIFLILLTNACVNTDIMQKVKKENDNVKNTKRFLYSNVFSPIEKPNKVLYFYKMFYKEIDSTNHEEVIVKDRIHFTSTADPLENNVYILTDTKIYKLSIPKIEVELNKEIETKKESVMKADSTKIDVITGYHENHSKVYKFNYSITEQIRKDILESKTLKFRYYAGIEMITIQIKDYKLKNVKELLKF